MNPTIKYILLRIKSSEKNSDEYRMLCNELIDQLFIILEEEKIEYEKEIENFLKQK